MTEQRPDPEVIKKLINKLETPETSQTNQSSKNPTLREEDKKVGAQLEQAVEGAAKIASESSDDQQG